jgi:tetratricopeptide (TPR) repeat protein
MAICKEMGTKFDQLNNAIGFLYLDQGDIPTAELYIKQAGSRSLLGLLALKRGDFQVALAEYENVLHQAKESGRAAQLFAAWTGLGKVYEALNDYEKAGQHYAEAAKLVEDLQSNLGPSERQAFLSVKVQGFNRSEPAEGLARLRLKERQSPVDVVLPPTLPQLHHEATP